MTVIWNLETSNLCWSMLQVAIYLIIAASICVSVEHIRHVVKYFFLRIRNNVSRRRTELDAYKCKPLATTVVSDASSFPKVLIQLPMFNELAVSEGAIDAACTFEVR